MTEYPDSKPIIVGVDGSPSSISALAKAAQLAKALDLPMEVITTYPEVIDLSFYYFPIEGSSLREEAEKTLERAVASAFGSNPVPKFERAFLKGPPTQVLIGRSENASMLVLGSRGHGGFAGLLLGSVSAACVAHAKCPVLIMHSGADAEAGTSAP
ncbi:universal stress protein [Arthrobacter rhombi]|uniref:universal stress protein n=1 Tax=Arthrobacter rhombi TaxID=71253 RepID=UPI003FD4739E